MSLWRKHPDLCIVSVLVACLFTFEYGEAALAAVGPRVAALRSIAEARIAEFVASEDQVSADAATVAAPQPKGVDPLNEPPVAAEATPGLGSSGVTGVPQFGFVPVCSDAGHFGCSR